MADLVDDQQRMAAEAAQLGVQPAGVMGHRPAGDPLGGGGEHHPVTGPAGADGQPGGEVRPAGPRRAEQQHVSFAVEKSGVPGGRSGPA